MTPTGGKKTQLISADQPSLVRIMQLKHVILKFLFFHQINNLVYVFLMSLRFQSLNCYITNILPHSTNIMLLDVIHHPVFI
jgi:hypothetical protein